MKSWQNPLQQILLLEHSMQNLSENVLASQLLHFLLTKHFFSLQCSAVQCSALHCTALHRTAWGCTGLHVGPGYPIAGTMS